MTYCVGLRTKTGVFVGADSVFSSASPSAHTLASSSRTAFGELQGDVGPDGSRYVSEEGLKVSIGSDTVVGFAGDVEIARAVIRNYFDGRKAGFGARESVHSALVSVTPCEKEAEILFAFYEFEQPCLVHINTLDQSSVEVDGLVQLGSELADGQHEWTEKFVSLNLEQLERLGTHPLHTERAFTNFLALLQSYGVHDHLLQHGVGGAFVAAWVTPTGARWQGSHLFVMLGEEPSYEDPMCATSIHEDVLCLVNNQTESTKLLSWMLSNENTDDTKARFDSAAEKCIAAWDAGTFDYFILLNRTRHVVTVVEMRGHLHHALVSFHAPHFDRKLGIVWTRELVSHANTIAGVDQPDQGYMSVWFFPYVGLGEGAQHEREQFAWECFADWNGEPGKAGTPV